MIHVLKYSIYVVFHSSVKPPPAVVAAVCAPLKEEEFPSLSGVAVSSPMTPAYSVQPKKTSSFQEEDFPALVSKIRPHKTAACSNSAWSTHTSVVRPTTQPPLSSRPAPQASSASSGPQLLSPSTSLSSRRKKKVRNSDKATRSPMSSDDEGKGMTQQELRSVPTMLDISSMLTVKGGNSKPPVTPNPLNQPPNPDPPISKASKKKKQPKNTGTFPTSVVVSEVPQSAISVETAAQKENVPEKTWNKTPPSVVTAMLKSGLTNGHTEKSPVLTEETVAVTPVSTTQPPLEQEEEEFPALTTKKPPPGTNRHNNTIHNLLAFSFILDYILSTMNTY